MGVIGQQLGAFLGGKLGNLAGGALGKYTGTGAEEGGKIGETLGGNLLGRLIPFKKGGKIKKTGAALMHKGEFVLPKGVKPTTHQLLLVKKRHQRRARKHKKKH